jgi:hypothetical protein
MFETVQQGNANDDLGWHGCISGRNQGPTNRRGKHDLTSSSYAISRRRFSPIPKGANEGAKNSTAANLSGSSLDNVKRPAQQGDHADRNDVAEERQDQGFDGEHERSFVRIARPASL